MTVVKQGQSLVDLALQYGGRVDRLFDVAAAMDVGITDPVAPGTPAELPQVADSRVAYFEKNRTTIAVSGNTSPGGIGYWYIGIDFKVS